MAASVKTSRPYQKLVKNGNSKETVQNQYKIDFKNF